MWVNFAFPDNGKVQVIDVETRRIIQQLEPGKAVLHMEFAPRGEAVWISARDDNRVVVKDQQGNAVAEPCFDVTVEAVIRDVEFAIAEPPRKGGF